jgi:hypothetical protein
MGRLAFLADLARVLGVLVRVEADRRALSVHYAVQRARRRAVHLPARSPARRRQLRQAISAADGLVPGGRNCVRRSLLELSLDGGAAKERFLAGFVSGGGSRSGHAWLESQPEGRTFDAVVTI